MNRILHPSRWPIICHVRYFVALYQISRHYEFWASRGFLPVWAESDYTEAAKIWRGEA